MVVIAERGGDAAAGGADGRETGGFDRLGGGDVPGVRQHERIARHVKRTKYLAAMLELGVVGRL